MAKKKLDDPHLQDRLFDAIRLGNGKSFQVYVEYLRFVDLWATAKEGITDA